jgi:hypothetical protein
MRAALHRGHWPQNPNASNAFFESYHEALFYLLAAGVGLSSLRFPKPSVRRRTLSRSAPRGTVRAENNRFYRWGTRLSRGGRTSARSAYRRGDGGVLACIADHAVERCTSGCRRTWPRSGAGWISGSPPNVRRKHGTVSLRRPSMIIRQRQGPHMRLFR